MLSVKTPSEVLDIIEKEFHPLEDRTEYVPLGACCGRVLAEDIAAQEYVPDFDRSTVDGYALRARDSFGCSESIPAILPVAGEVKMGKAPGFELPKESCCAIPTGGQLPEGADCAVMLEYTEDYGDGTVGIFKAGAPGQNLICRGDDVYPGKTVLRKGSVLRPQDTGALAAMGITEVPVVKRVKVSLISTGDELVPPEARPGPGQVRDVNGPAVKALLESFGAEVKYLGIVKDNEPVLMEKVSTALEASDAVILSGGSSVGVKDAACRIISKLGELLLHGIAVKPGKPTIIGKAGDKAIVGLPGHPAAAFVITKLFVLPILSRLMDRRQEEYTVPAVLSENVGANHGREEIVSVRLVKEENGLRAEPVRGKSGLISSLSSSDGYFIIPRDCEGMPRGAEVKVFVNFGG